MRADTRIIFPPGPFRLILMDSDDRIYCSPHTFIDSSESEQTRNSYRASLVEFCISKWGMDLTEQVREYGKCELSHEEEERLLSRLAEYARDPKRSEILADLQEFRSYLNRRKIKYRNGNGRPLSIRSKKHHIAGIQSFLSMNEIRFMSKIHRNSFQIREQPLTDDLPFNPERALAVYNQLSHAGKGMLLFMISTGTRLEFVVNILQNDIDWTRDPVRVRIRAKISKTKSEGFAFLTKECARYLKTVWLSPIEYYDRRTKERLIQPRRDLYMRAATNRNKGLRDQSNTKKAGERPDYRTDQRLFPMSESTAYETLRTAIERAGYTEKNEVGNLKLHPHSTRKMFRNEVGRWGSPDAAHMIMQHKPGRDAEYLTLSEEQCAEDFRKAEPYLTIGISDEARVALVTKNEHAAAILKLQGRVSELEDLTETLKELRQLD